MKYKEDQLQMSTAKLLDYHNLLWTHCANERRTSPQAGARLKAKGVKKGVPDVLIFEPRGKYYGLAIELKIKPNKPTKDQERWMHELIKKGWFCDVCYSFDEVAQLLDNYLKL